MNDSSPAPLPAPPSASQVPAKVVPDSKILTWWRGRSRVEKYSRHVVSILLWAYFIGILAFDLDGWLIRVLPLQLRWIVEYKFLVFLAVSALTLNFVPRRRFWSWTIYVVLYPFTRAIFGMFVAAYILIKLKSWPILFSVLNLLFAAIKSFKINYLLYVMAFIAALVVLISDSAIDQTSAAIVLVAVTVAFVGRRLVSIFRPSPIFNVYVKSMAWMMDYSRRKLIKPTSLRGVDISNQNLVEFEKQYGNLSTAVLLIELSGFLRGKFKSYRNSGSAVGAYLFALATLFVLVTGLLTFANMGIYRADPASFHISGTHKFFDFFYYTFGALTAQRSGEIIPAHLSAKLLSMLETVLYWLLAAGILLSLYFSIKRGRDDEAVDHAIEKLKTEEQRMNAFVEEKFALPLDEAIGVLEKLQWGLMKFIGTLRAARDNL